MARATTMARVIDLPDILAAALLLLTVAALRRDDRTDPTSPLRTETSTSLAASHGRAMARVSAEAATASPAPTRPTRRAWRRPPACGRG